ncbi:MAG TPA: DNA methyltransferase [Polyangiaceae bacterium]|nr:DNA methyltransferase [Polyangiaceae bacterium]
MTERPGARRPKERRAARERPVPIGAVAAERKQRRALSHVGGAVEMYGDDANASGLLASALAVEPDEESTRTHVHGFHSYPARLHPTTATRLIAAFSGQDGSVLDPFCGSGTVLVEARLLGRRGFGVDANPLAIELTWLKTSRFGDAERDRLLQGAERVAAAAEDRRQRRAGATRRYGPEDQALFEPHILLELDGLAQAIGDVADPDSRRALRLVLSSLLTKVSRRHGDASSRSGQRRLPSGYAIRFFEDRTAELAERLRQFAERLPESSRSPELHAGDARRLAGIADRTVDLVVTSPPYPGVYDYLEHHVDRLRWLGIDAKPFAGREIGSRRQLGNKPFARALGDWESDLGRCLEALGRVLRPSGLAALVLADSVLSGRAVRAGELIRRVAPRAGFALVAGASQERPYFHAPTARAFSEAPRREHLLLLRPVNQASNPRRRRIVR